jgi:hypothetical protein
MPALTARAALNASRHVEAALGKHVDRPRALQPIEHERRTGGPSFGLSVQRSHHRVTRSMLPIDKHPRFVERQAQVAEPDLRGCPVSQEPQHRAADRCG